MSGKPRIFVTQPVADSAIKRLRAIGSVKVFPDDSRIIPHKTLISAVRKADILFCLLDDKIDLRVATRTVLERAGVRPEHVDAAPPCTRCEPERFFSYRRDGTDGGVHMGFIAMCPV